MSTSGSYNFPSTVTRNDIIGFALRKAHVKRRGMSLTADQISDAAFALNLILAQLKENSDGAGSIKMWLRKRIRIFLQVDKDIYDTNDATDHIVAEDDLTTTATKVAGSATDLTIDVDSIAGIADNDVLGIVLDDGTIHWTTVNGAPVGDTVTFDDALASAAAIDNAIYAYTANAQPPVNIITRMLRYEGGTEANMTEMDLNDYDEIYDKTVTGTPVSIYYERRRLSGVFYLDVKANDDLEQILMTVRYPVEDMASAGDNFDLPSQWLLYLGWRLCIDQAPEYGVPIEESWNTNLLLAAPAATNSDPETTNMFFEPDRIDEYGY